MKRRGFLGALAAGLGLGFVAKKVDPMAGITTTLRHPYPPQSREDIYRFVARVYARDLSRRRLAVVTAGEEGYEILA